ncbi:ABC transporter permease [Paenibacillus glycanilyticus]|uniref:ABC transporter permease n=1 Tax=Paenibacillus glycanilyticus TaxID=126569 RepID=UPI000FDB3984|nr:ABC transporter permease subunit [Paenibacillus glycanilyticus]
MTATELAQARSKVNLKKSQPSLWRKLKGQWDLQLMVIPAVLLILLFSYFPMFGLISAFQDYNPFKGYFHSDFVGFKHFHRFLNNPDFALTMRNTICISLLKLFISFPAPIVLALMLNEVNRMAFKRIVQTITYLPHFLSWVIVGGLVMSLLAVDGGSVNTMLIKLHLIEEPINWLSIPEYFWGILIGTSVWKEIGFGSIVYLAAIAGINPQLYEAASVDGASRFKQIFLVTIPSIAPVVTIFLILAVGNLLNAGFEDILVLTNNLNNAIVSDYSTVIDTYVYQSAFKGFSQYSYAAAAGMFKSVINVGLLLGANYLARRYRQESLF